MKEVNEIHLSRKDARKIVNSAITIANALGTSGSVAIVDTNNNFIDGMLNGYASPMAYAIEANNVILSEHASARIKTADEQIIFSKRTKAPKIDAPLLGGCPIYTKEGIHIGGAGFSEQIGVVNKQIMSKAIEACGFLSNTSVMRDITTKKSTEF